MDKETALKYVTIVIDNLEGGYYHPDMKSKLANGEVMMNSGETMYGIDRKAGGAAVNDSTAGRAFWALVDEYYGNHHSDAAYYNDKADGAKRDIPATVGQLLKRHATDIIQPLFEKYCDKYLDPAAAQKIQSDPALLIQFFYATYNGPGTFRSLAEEINRAYTSGTRDAKTLYNLLQAKRRTMGGGEYGNALYQRGADIIDQIIADYFGLDYASDNTPATTGGALKWLLIAVAVVGVSCYIFKKK